ncbi:MAG TPA: hypothetical protein VFN75_07065 [Pseudonocardiaceae bacterium]|nr:hypothetical protein [Pseudonocardiaceae bacterium]
MVSLVKGFAGKPAHAPLTDVGIGAYTAGVAMLVAGAAGFQEAAMATASVIGKIITPAVVLGVVSWILLLAGGYLGGALTFVYGVRVLKKPDAAMVDALIPGRADRTD